ncbi:MAG: type II secretion system protein [Verrucomicrobia bacterium]|nr:type II secretion system protein [Verrucomicrobiota bacterium]MCH8513755.1 type II secretion system GspH family protein [Kiritimatiellia bacterium]
MKTNITPRKNAASAFTLIEMLVVIAILALLISIITPTVSRTLDRARTISCLSNMRQAAAAILQYASENEGRLMYFQTPGHHDPNTVPITNWAGVLVRDGYVDAPMVQSPTDIRTGHVFYCPSGLADGLYDWSRPPSSFSDNPSLQRPWAAPMDTDEGVRFLHIWFGISARTENSGWPFVRHWRHDGDQRPTSVTNVRYADKTVMLYDGNWSANDTPHRIPARHGIPRNSTNFAFFDGRVENIRTREFGWAATAPDTYPRFRN